MDLRLQVSVGFKVNKSNIKNSSPILLEELQISSPKLWVVF